MSELTSGTVLEGKYQIETLLGAGNQAQIYTGIHLGLGRKIAIKVLYPHSGGSYELAVRRFEQEAMLLSQLRDPHTITLYDYGKLGSKGLFMVFEYIEGQSLKELIEQEGPISPARTAKILRQILTSLQEAHAIGVLHRDIKPENIMIYDHAGQTDLIKVLDFGIAKVLDEALPVGERPRTAHDTVVGTLRYLPPEALKPPIKFAPSYDLYNVGLVAYELLTSAPAITGKSVEERIRQLISPHNVTLPTTVNAPPLLCELIHKCLRKDPKLRYQSAAEVLRDLSIWSPKPQARASASAPLNHDAPQGAAEVTAPPPKQPIALQAPALPELETSSTLQMHPLPKTQLLHLPQAQAAPSLTRPMHAIPRIERPLVSPEEPSAHQARSHINPIADHGSPSLEPTPPLESPEEPLRGHSKTTSGDKPNPKLLTKKIVVDELPFEQMTQAQLHNAKLLPAIDPQATQAAQVAAPASPPQRRPTHHTAPHAPLTAPLEGWIKALLCLAGVVFVIGAVVLGFALIKLLN